MAKKKTDNPTAGGPSPAAAPIEFVIPSGDPYYLAAARIYRRTAGPAKAERALGLVLVEGDPAAIPVLQDRLKRCATQHEKDAATAALANFSQ